MSRRTATRITPGAISLSSSSHLPLSPYSNRLNPVTLPPGRARLSTKPAPTGSMIVTNMIGTVRVVCCNAAMAAAPSGHDDVRGKRDQFRHVSAGVAGVCAPASLDAAVAAVGPAELLQRLYERRFAGLSFRIVRGRVHEHADAPHALSLLRPRRERPCCAAPPRSVMNSRRRISTPSSGAGIVSAQTSALIGAEIGIKTIAAVHNQCPLMGQKTRITAPQHGSLL